MFKNWNPSIFFFLKRAKKLLPYIDIGEANWGMARAKKNKKQKKEEGGEHRPRHRGKRISLQVPPDF